MLSILAVDSDHEAAKRARFTATEFSALENRVSSLSKELTNLTQIVEDKLMDKTVPAQASNDDQDKLKVVTELRATKRLKSEASTLVTDADKPDFVERAVLSAVQDLQAAQKIQGESVNKELAKHFSTMQDLQAAQRIQGESVNKELDELHSKIAKGDAASVLGQMEARLQICEKEQERLANSLRAAVNGFLTISAFNAIEARLDKLEEVREHSPRVTGATAQARILESSTEPADDDARAVKEGTEVRAAEGSEALVNYEEFEESVWDSVFLIGVPEIGSVGSVYVTIILFANALLQLYFCAIINDNFTVAEIDSSHVSAMRHWRASYAHSPELMNKITFQSFVSSVCNFESGLQMSTEAADLLSAITNYLPLPSDYAAAEPVVGPIWPYIESTGIYMSACAVMIWLMTISAKMQAVFHKGCAISIMQRGWKTELARNVDSYTVVAVTTNRKFCCLFILTLQFLVLSLLGFSGTFYIIRTLDMRDLLLNCSALAIVLDLDELFFAAMIPLRTRHVLTSLESIPRPASNNIKGMSWASLFSLTFVGVFLSCSVLELQSQAEILKQTRIEICGGNKYFIATTDTSGVMTAAKVLPVEESEDRYAFKAMRQLVLDEDFSITDRGFSLNDLSASSSGVTGGPWSFQEWVNAPLDEVVGWWNRDCVDMLPISTVIDEMTYTYAPHYLTMLRDTSKDGSLHSCADVEHYCNLDVQEGVLARIVCPVTCGCNDPGPRLLLRDTNNGCSPTCYKTAVYETSMRSRECKDLELDSPYWTEYANGIVSYVESYGGDNASRIKEQILAKGCGVLSKTFTFNLLGRWKDPCEPHGAQLKPFTYACPVSCQCESDFRYLCPSNCR